MKRFKRMITLVLCAVLTLSVNYAPAKAQSTDCDTYVLQQAYEFMQIVTEDAATFGLSSSAKEFTLSQCIPVYNVTEGKFTQSSDVDLYFVLDGKTPVGELTVIKDEADLEPAVQFSTDLANTYKTYGKDQFTVVLGDKTPYFCQNSATNTQIVSTTAITNQGSTSTGIKRAASRASYPTSYYANLPIVNQGNYGVCWAAALASVGQYRTGIVKTPFEVADYMGIGYDDGGNAYDIQEALQSIYGVTATIVGGALSTTQLKQYLTNGYGIVGSFFTADYSAGHAVGINGYKVSGTKTYVSIMDPNYTSYVLISPGTDADGYSTWYFSYTGYGRFYWQVSVYC